LRGLQQDKDKKQSLCSEKRKKAKRRKRVCLSRISIAKILTSFRSTFEAKLTILKEKKKREREPNAAIHEGQRQQVKNAQGN
jgi:hypothetical protein